MDYKVSKELKLPNEIFDARYHSKKDGLVCVATIAGDVHLVQDGELTSTLKRHHKGAPIRRVRFDKEGRMVTIAKTIRIHDLQQEASVQTLKRNDTDKVTFYSVMPLGPNLVCAGDDSGKLFVWDTRTPKEPVFTSQDCEQYISGIDGRYESRRIVCTSGEGTLTAYDLRANKMIEPQSELFEAGFQCVKLVESNKKVVIGGEDGAIYVFNQNEWAHTSGKFAISDDTHNRGKCSIECLDVLPDNSEFVTGCSDGRIRTLTLWPHQIVSETIVCKRNSLDTLHVSPHEGKRELVVGGDKYINLVTYEERASEDEAEAEKDSDDDDDDDDSDDEDEDGDTSSGDSSSKEGEEPPAKDKKGKKKDKDADNDDDGDGGDDENNKVKKPKVDTEDYLGVF